ncbi:MAG: carbohydrate ABC transporter permease [Acidimicrobiales bacterium]
MATHTEVTPLAGPPAARRGRPGRRGAGTSRPVGSYWLADLVGLGPTLLLYGVFILGALGVAIALSLFNWNGVGSFRFVGAENWTAFFHDPLAAHSLEVTALLTLVSWAVQTPLAMGLGLFIAGRQRYRAVYATIYLLPLLLSTAGLALMWQALLDPYFGGIAWLGNHLDVHVIAQSWLGDPSTALWTIVALIAWQFVPFHMLLYRMGRTQIPDVLYEAAEIDGATALQRFLHVTLPQLRYTIVVSGTLIVVGSLTYFDIIYILTSGGPGDTTRVLSMDMYDAAFVANDFGYASVLAVVLGVIGIAVALLLVRASGFASMSSQREGGA